MFFETLLAQAGGAELGQLAGMFIPMILIFAVFYFLLIRPQQKQQKELEKKISSLKKGDRVVTAGGIYGEYIGDKESGKIASIKIDENTKIEVVKKMIQAVIPKDEKLTGEEVQSNQ